MADTHQRKTTARMDPVVHFEMPYGDRDRMATFYEPKQPDMPTGPAIVIAVEDITRAMKRVADAGGKVLGEPMDIPGGGRYVSFSDPEGNRSSILQPVPRNRQTSAVDG